VSHKNDWSTENPKPSSERGLLSQTSQCGPRNMHRRRFPQLHAQYVRAVHANKPTNQPTTSSHPINHMGSVSHPANKSRQRSRSHGENSFDCRWPFPRRRKANDEQTTNDERRTTNDERRTTNDADRQPQSVTILLTWPTPTLFISIGSSTFTVFITATKRCVLCNRSSFIVVFCDTAIKFTTLSLCTG